MNIKFFQMQCLTVLLATLMTPFSAVALGAQPTESPTATSHLVTGSKQGPGDALTLWYTQPADKWIKALPVGNGRLGAMIFGQPQKERLQLNDVTVWSGNPQPDADRKDAYKSLPELRRLIREGQYDQAEKFANQNFNGPAPYNASYQTLGDLNFEFQLPAGEVTDYRRSLDIAQAVAKVEFKAGDIKFEREIFSSAPDAALVQHFNADKKGALSFTMQLTRVEKAQTRFDEKTNTLIMTGNTGSTLGYEVHARILAKGGKVTGTNAQLTIDGADEVTVLLTDATTFLLDYDKGYKGGDLSIAGKRMDAVAAKKYDTLKTAHVADYQKYFKRVSLDLGKNDLDKPTDERLRGYKDTKDASFAALFYQFGRYLLISSSRPENPLPSNSQGIWGDGLDMPWKCDYKSNINYEMNYWGVESGNLSEMHLPMLHMTQNLVKPGTKTAQAYFGPDTPGWVVGYTTNGWSWTSPGAQLSWGIWFGGSGWMCQHLWEHYAFTRDLEYLKSVYPTMKGAAEFWMANLVEGTDGKLITSPSSSPENNFTADNGKKSTICEGATMEKSIVWDLLNNTARAATVLGIDADFRKKVETTRDRIRPIQVGKRGQIMEWGGDWDEPKSDHRHVSHLFGLHPGHEITALGTPQLAEAAKQTLKERGDDGTGWSLAWKINFWARLRDGDHAHNLINYQLRYTEELKTIMAGAGGTYPNLFDAHPPFQIDGNLGFISGINEMLLQSQENYTDASSPNKDCYYVDLLPALPSAWANGNVKGLRARGGFEIDMAWQNGKLQEATVRSLTGSNPKVRYGNKLLELSLNPGKSIKINGELQIVK
jgi:alpha-L-fucosidase 2